MDIINFISFLRIHLTTLQVHFFTNLAPTQHNRVSFRPPCSIPLWLQIVPQNKIESDGVPLRDGRWNSNGIAGGNGQPSGRGFPRCFSDVEEALGSLSIFPMGIIWIWWKPNLNNIVNILFTGILFFSSLGKIFLPPHI